MGNFTLFRVASLQPDLTNHQLFNWQSGVDINICLSRKTMCMYPTNEWLDKKPASKKKNKETYQLPYIRKKLRTYVAENDNVKDLRLLECHVHCFISLSWFMFPIVLWPSAVVWRTAADELCTFVLTTVAAKLPFFAIRCWCCLLLLLVEIK